MLVASLGACSTVRNAPGINLLFGDDAPLGVPDPTATEGVEYEVAFQGLGVGETPEETAENQRLRAIVEDQARIFTLQDKPPPSVALLRRRAAADVELVERALKSEGYYEGSAVITVDKEAKRIGEEPDADDPVEETVEAEREEPIFEDLADPDTPPVVNVFVRKGPRYALARQVAVIEPPVDAETAERVQAAAASRVPGPAQGVAVVESEQEALQALGAIGRPYADKGARRAIANFDEDTLSVETAYSPGPYTVYGPVTITGETTVETAYIRDFITWREGQPVRRDTLLEAQRELQATRLFDAVSVEIPPEPPEQLAPGQTFVAPVVITVEEAKHRTISGGLSYSTTTGPGGRVRWENRNLFGQNEQLSAGLDLNLERQSALFTYKKPRWSKPERDLIGRLEFFNEDNEAFEAFGVTGALGFEEKFSDRLSGSLGVAFDATQVKEDGEDKRSYLIGLPATLAYDASDSLLDPTEGYRLSLLATPWAGVFDNEATTFGIVDANGSAYIPIDRRHRYVIATRGRLAAIFAESRDRVPAQQRLYAGGGGSVRGFENRFVGPLDDDDDPIGGLTAAELGLELRLRFGDFGVVPFVDAGVVSEELFDEYDEVRFGAGIGGRYYSPIGPVRFDLAIPLNPRDVDDPFQFYISIGQAF